MAAARSAWRLVVLLGLAWVGLLLLGSTAHAAEADHPAPTPAGATSLLPAQDQVLDTADALAPALRVHEVADTVTVPVASAVTGLLDRPADAAAPDSVVDRVATSTTGHVAAVTSTVSDATDSVASATPALPAAKALDAVHAVGDAVTETAQASDGEQLLTTVLPRATAVTTPVVSGVTTQLRTTTAATIDLVDELTAPIPLATPVIDLVGGTTGNLVGGATDLLTATAYVVGGGADAVLTEATGVLSPVLQGATAAIGTIGVGTAASGPAPASGFGHHAAPPVPPATTLSEPLPTTVGVLGPQSLPGPAVPPPDDVTPADPSAVQPAPATDTTLAVRVSGAGSTVVSSGSGTGSTGGPDLTKVLIERLGRTPAVTVAPTAAPVRPMPGTPLADPGFSPD